MAVGGLLGTGARLGLDAMLPHAGNGFPWSTFVANILGALLLGWLVGGLWKLPQLPRWIRAGVGTGMLGSFTTFSAVMVSAVGLSTAGLSGTAIAYVAASVLVGIASATVGLRLGSLEANRRMPRGIADRGETL